MTETLELLLACLAGALLGVLFFGGLWLTLRMALTSPRAPAWFLGSLLLRIGVTLTGIYFVAAGDWRRLLACMLGLLLARSLLIRSLWPPVIPALGQQGGPQHEPNA